jgi:hypothetical protein
LGRDGRQRFVRRAINDDLGVAAAPDDGMASVARVRMTRWGRARLGAAIAPRKGPP